MRRVWIALLAAALLAGGGAALALVAAQTPATAQEDEATTQPEDEATDEAPATSDDDGAAADKPARVRPERGAVLGGVLDELVADGTITQAQADAITDALADRIATLREEFRGRRGVAERGGFGFGQHFADLADALEDGVIDADELAELGEDHLFNDPEGPAAPYLDDGQLTEDELRELAAELRPHGRRGAAPDADGDAPSAEENLFSG